MAELLLSLVVPLEVSEAVEDLLIARGDLVGGFTTSAVDGHGSAIALTSPAEHVAGHSPRTLIRTIGNEEALRQLLGLVKASLPHANIYYWLAPVVEAGRL